MNIAGLANGNFSDLFLLPFDIVGLAFKRASIWYTWTDRRIHTSRPCSEQFRLTLRAEEAEVPISYRCRRISLCRPDLILIAYLIYSIRARVRKKKGNEKQEAEWSRVWIKWMENSLYSLLQILQEGDRDEYLYLRWNILIQQRIIWLDMNIEIRSYR